MLKTYEGYGSLNRRVFSLQQHISIFLMDLNAFGWNTKAHVNNSIARYGARGSA